MAGILQQLETKAQVERAKQTVKLAEQCIQDLEYLELLKNITCETR